jgi:DhnA family fructose-bisphosphate aldolase class Ia
MEMTKEERMAMATDRRIEAAHKAGMAVQAALLPRRPATAQEAREAAASFMTAAEHMKSAVEWLAAAEALEAKPSSLLDEGRER